MGKMVNYVSYLFIRDGLFQELVRLVVTHKAQLIRKDQYIRELESYIDNLLVRVMESSP